MRSSRTRTSRSASSRSKAWTDQSRSRPEDEPRRPAIERPPWREVEDAGECEDVHAAKEDGIAPPDRRRSPRLGLDRRVRSLLSMRVLVLGHGRCRRQHGGLSHAGRWADGRCDALDGGCAGLGRSRSEGGVNAQAGMIAQGKQRCRKSRNRTTRRGRDRRCRAAWPSFQTLQTRRKQRDEAKSRRRRPQARASTPSLAAAFWRLSLHVWLCAVLRELDRRASALPVDPRDAEQHGRGRAQAAAGCGCTGALSGQCRRPGAPARSLAMGAAIGHLPVPLYRACLLRDDLPVRREITHAAHAADGSKRRSWSSASRNRTRASASTPGLSSRRLAWHSSAQSSVRGRPGLPS